jgi:hypothetical protein
MSIITTARIISTKVGAGEATQQLEDFQKPVKVKGLNRKP